MSRLSSLGYSTIATSFSTENHADREPDSGRGGELTISQMARLYGCTLRTLRFYEDRGLIKPRREGNARYYRDADRARLETILRGKKLGFTLSEISDLIGGKAASETVDIEARLQPQQIVNQIGHLERQRDEIDNAIARLRATQGRMAGASAAA